MHDLSRLTEHLQSLGRVMLGYSGGVDSALLAVASARALAPGDFLARSEEHTSELQSLLPDALPICPLTSRDRRPSRKLNPLPLPRDGVTFGHARSLPPDRASPEPRPRHAGLFRRGGFRAAGGGVRAGIGSRGFPRGDRAERLLPGGAVSLGARAVGAIRHSGSGARHPGARGSQLPRESGDRKSVV